ncbi:hypothetical protein [Anabaena azotica]|uniref:Uncharacterized protein n=1 Tax=Anabaena azotica FACHB-119 TaxID=947527 RepID=A0ABR8DGC3_9NOST|nr:hypothetical protein [Anabaena azotica]MBD2505460.1 hypothetical protein [Anabaena azotica FACHB-119]
MAVATKNEAVEQWLSQTVGLKLVQATNAEGKIVSPEDVLKVAAECEWVEIDDISDTPYAKDGLIFPTTLEIGWGNADDAYTQERSEKAGVYFFNAYYQVSDRNGGSGL